MAKRIVYKITEENEKEFTELEKAYYEMSSLQTLLTNVILANSNLTDNGKFYTELYVEKFAILEKQKSIFQEKVLKPVFYNNFDWEADFLNRTVKVDVFNEQ